MSHHRYRYTVSIAQEEASEVPLQKEPLSFGSVGAELFPEPCRETFCIDRPPSPTGLLRAEEEQDQQRRLLQSEDQQMSPSSNRSLIPKMSHRQTHPLQGKLQFSLLDLFVPHYADSPVSYYPYPGTQHPVVPAVQDASAWCPCLRAAPLCPFHPNLVARERLYPQEVLPELRDRCDRYRTTLRPVFMGILLHGFPEYPADLQVTLRTVLAQEQRWRWSEVFPYVHRVFVMVNRYPLADHLPFLSVIITPKDDQHACRLNDDVSNQVALLLQAKVQEAYQMFTLTMSVVQLPQRKGFSAPFIQYPWQVSPDSVCYKQSARMLCMLKILMGKKNLKAHVSRRQEFTQMMRVMLSVNQAQMYVTQTVGELPYFQIEGTENATSFKELDAACVFVYTSSLRGKTSVVDDAVARNVQKFIDTWKVPGFCQSFLLTRYNFPVCLFDPQNQKDSFQQIAEQLRLLHQLPKQAKSVYDFIRTVRGDVFTEMLSGYQRSEQHGQRVKYYEKRKLNAQISKMETAMKTMLQQDCIVPHALMESHKNLVDRVDVQAQQVTDQERRSLQAMFDTQVVPILAVEGYHLLQQNLDHYNMIDLDPKLPWNMLYRQFMELLRTVYIPNQGKLRIFDTVLLTDESELSFLMVAMYISRELLPAASNRSLRRDFQNLLLFGDSGTGKSFLIDSLTYLLNAGNIPFATLQQMFKGNQCFVEKQVVNSSAIVTQEVSVQAMTHAGAKEFLDVSLSKRKINVKFSDPVSLTRGVPFIMATNDFFGDYQSICKRQQSSLEQVEHDQIDTNPTRISPTQEALPFFRRTTVIPFYDREGDWLKAKSYNSDFNLIPDKLKDIDVHVPVALALLGAAFMLNSRISLYLESEEDVRLYAKFMQDFFMTHIGTRLKYMNESSQHMLDKLYEKYCHVSVKDEFVYSNKTWTRQMFHTDAKAFSSCQQAFHKVKQEFQAEYSRLYRKFVRHDAQMNRLYHAGYTAQHYQAIMQKILMIAQVQLYRVCRHHGPNLARCYVTMIQAMNLISNSLPECIKIDCHMEGHRRQFTIHAPGPIHDASLKRPILHYFIFGRTDKLLTGMSDFDSVSSSDQDDTEEVGKNQCKAFLYSTIKQEEAGPSSTRVLGNKTQRLHRPCDTRDPGATVKRRQQAFAQITKLPQQVPCFQYNSDDEMYKKRLLDMFEKNPLITREVPYCTKCQLIKTSVKQTRRSYKKAVVSLAKNPTGKAVTRPRLLD